MHRNHHLRTGRYSGHGEVYFITSVTFLRRRLFVRHATLVKDSFKFFEERKLVRSYAWVVMPDHIHWVVQLLEEKLQLATLMMRFKGWTAREINRADATKGRIVWQRAYYERRLTTPEDLEVAVGYVVDNPVVARLCRTSEVYPHVFVGDPWDA